MILKPFYYQTNLRDRLKAEIKTWDWFSSVKVKAEQLQEFKKELLKNAYRLEKDDHAELYEKVKVAKEKLALDIDVTLYQAQNSFESNAAISYISGEAHIVFSGQIMKLLTSEEMLSVIAHELSHVNLFSIENTEFEVADRIITSIANDPRSEDEYVETARIFRLYMELYCDRGSLIVTENIDSVLSSLIKINTGLEKVSVPSYLKQVDEILSIDKTKALEQSHPENYIRVKALDQWHKNQDESEEFINKLMVGELDLNSLDIFKQEKLKIITLKLIQCILKPKWIRTTAVLSLAKRYDSKFAPSDAIEISDEFVASMVGVTSSVKEYFSFVLLDFALVDPSLENNPMGVAFQLAENLGLKDQYNEAVKKELNLGVRKLTELQSKAIKSLAEIQESKQEHLYND